MIPELNRCKFCGAEAYVQTLHDRDNNAFFRISCCECDNEVEDYGFDEAVNFWNNINGAE